MQLKLRYGLSLLHRVILLSFFLAAAFLTLTPVSATAADRVVLVLDSSGSMAGQIEGVTKLDIARDAVGSILETLPEGTELGLMAYGHRRKKDCGDIETLAEVGKPDKGRIMSAVNALRAVGKTPLGESVRMAAEKLRYTEDRATVILVSDGKENCGVDPCKLGAALKKDGVDFKTHVIGFDIRSGEDAGLRCLAKATGGVYVAAEDASSLKQALSETVKKAAAPAPQPEKPKAPAGVKVRTLVKEGGPEWTGDIGVALFGPPQGLEGKREQVANAWRKKSGYIFKGVKPGKYLMRVVLPDHQHITQSREIIVPENGARVEDVVLNIGQVRFDYALSEGGEPLSWDAGWDVLEPEADFEGNREKIANFWRKKSGNVFWLPAGTWLIKGVLADAQYMSVSKTIEVVPGGAERHSFNFDGGLVRFDARLSTEGEAFEGDLGWTILGEPEGLEGKRPKIANFWRKKSGSIFVLPAGSWTLVGELADHRHVKLRDTIKVTPGSEKLHDFNFKAGIIRFDVTVEGKETNDEVGLEVLSGTPDLSGKREKVASFWRKHSGHIAILPEGEYLLKGVLADTTNVTGTTKFSVSPGDEKPVALDLSRK